MLYGIATPLAAASLERGYRVRLAIPFGEYWFPYLMRRLAERPANLAFFLKGALSRGWCHPDAVDGIWSAVLTPIDDELRPDASRAVAYYRDLLQRGCDGINRARNDGRSDVVQRRPAPGLHGSAFVERSADANA